MSKRKPTTKIHVMGSNGRLYWVSLYGRMEIDWQNGPKVYGVAPLPPARPKMMDVIRQSAAIRHHAGHDTGRPRLVRQPHATVRRTYSGDALTQPNHAEYRTPTGRQSMETHVFVPASLAFILAVPFAIIGGGVAGYLGYNPLLWSIATFLLTFALVIFWRIHEGDKQLVKYEILKADGVIEEVIEDEPGQRQIPIPSHGKAVMVTDNNKTTHPSEDDWRKFGKAMRDRRYYERNDAWSRNELCSKFSFMTQPVYNRCIRYLQKNKMTTEDWRKRSRLNQMGWEYIQAYLPQEEN